MKVVLATGNAGKVREMSEILSKYGIESVSQKDVGADVSPEENGATFEENAEIKARAVAQLCELPAVADDSGLCIDALGGRPGIYSARYGGDVTYDEKIKGILSEMEGVSDRTARFMCAVVMAFPDGTKVSATGSVEGKILTERRGSGGFGYDSIFFCDELGKSFGEAQEEEKNSVSHRGRALTNLCDKLAGLNI